MLDDLKTFERVADEAIGRLPLLQLPARAVLAGLHWVAFLGRHGRQLGGTAEPAVGEAIMTRIGHSLPLLCRLPAEPYGESADDAIGAFREVDPDGAQLMQLLTYLHFSEFMPEAHRGHFVVERSGAKFRLLHRDVPFAEAQARDITLSELAIPFPLEEAARIEPEFARLAQTSPQVDWGFVARFMHDNAHKYMTGIAEADLITDVSINSMFGFGRDRYLGIRAALLALAEFCEKLATTIHAMVIAGAMAEDRFGEGLEWASANLNANFVIGLVSAVSGAHVDEVERFLELYTVDFRATPPRHWGGDGFFPPFARFEQGYLFSPSLVLAFLQVRNAIYAFSKKEQRTFDRDVSRDLEPVLLRQVGELLRRDGWIAVEDVPFPGGQLDLLVGSPDHDGVLLVQAKGNLPPQGARLTERLAGRVREGVRQIERFAALAPADQDAVIAKALGRRATRFDVRHALLVRSCFGAPEVMGDDFPHVRITLPLLALALELHRREGMPTIMPALIEAVARSYAETLQATEPRWEEGDVTLNGTRMTIPLLKWRDGSLEALRRRSWAARTNEEPLPDASA